MRPPADPPITIHLRDLGAPLVEAWRAEFAGVPSVTISQGDIFSDRPGPIGPDDPTDVRADAIVSPANSFGFMDGGIDLVYTYQFGPGLQDRLQERIAREHGGELPVGAAVVVATGHPDIPWCVSAPTMRLPGDVSATLNAYLAFRAALRAVLEHNARGPSTIRTLLSPGLGTAVGRMPVHRCARQMRIAWGRVLGEEAFVPRSLGAIFDAEADLLR